MKILCWPNTTRSSHEIDLENVEIVDRSPTWRQRIILEAWHSVRDKNSINEHIALLSVYKTGADPGEGRRVTIPPPLSLSLLAVICSRFFVVELIFSVCFLFSKDEQTSARKSSSIVSV